MSLFKKRLLTIDEIKAKMPALIRAIERDIADANDDGDVTGAAKSMARQIVAMLTVDERTSEGMLETEPGYGARGGG